MRGVGSVVDDGDQLSVALSGRAGHVDGGDAQRLGIVHAGAGLPGRHFAGGLVLAGILRVAQQGAAVLGARFLDDGAAEVDGAAVGGHGKAGLQSGQRCQSQYGFFHLSLPVGGPRAVVRGFINKLFKLIRLYLICSVRQSIGIGIVNIKPMFN